MKPKDLKRLEKLVKTFVIARAEYEHLLKSPEGFKDKYLLKRKSIAYNNSVKQVEAFRRKHKDE